MQDEKKRPINNPRPKEVKHRYILRSNSWCYVNVCPWCDTTQGPSMVVQNAIEYSKELIAKPPMKVQTGSAQQRETG